MQRWVASSPAVYFSRPPECQSGDGCIAHEGAGFPLGLLGAWLSRLCLSGPAQGDGWGTRAPGS